MDVPPEMSAAVSENGAQLLSTTGVTGIDIGFTEENGIPTENIAIRVFVTDITNIPAGIPETLAGFPVVILQRNPVPDADDLARYEPLLGGVSVGIVKGSLVFAGTLGGIVRENGTGELRGLSCAHVFAAGVPGDPVEQPEPNPPQPANVIGTLLRSSFPTTPTPFPPFTPIGFSDAAVFTIARSAAAAIVDIGPVNGTAIPRLGDRVMKRGKATGLTHGIVDGVVGIHGQTQNGVILNDQFTVRVDSSKSPQWSAGGDSGSLVVKEDTREIVGLHWGTDPNTGFGVANKIDNVAADLGISLFWPIPQISALNPSQGTSKGGDQVTISGVGFQLASTVTIGGVPVSFQLISDSQIVVPQTPPGNGAVDVLVSAPGGTSLVGRAESTFTYLSAGSTVLISPRFFGDDVLASCLSGHRIFDGSGDPPESVALIQQALSDLGFGVNADGVFGPDTDDAVTAYETSKGITPNDPVVGPETIAALDADFAHELLDAKANAVAGTQFDLGDRIGTRVDLEDGFATCDFQNGICVEIGHVVAYAMPSSVQTAWVAAGGPSGTLGRPTSDPFLLDETRSVQEFTFAAFVFGDAQNFALSLDFWEASVAGGSMIGLPLGPPQPIGAGAASFVQHDQGVVLATPGTAPQPLPQAVFDLWSAQEAAGSSLGPPTGFAFPSASDTTVFPFLSGGIALSSVGVPSLVGLVSDDLQRYFQPEDNSVFLTRPMVGTVATPIIGGTTAFAAMRDDIASTSGATDFIYILSWHCNVDLPLVATDPTSTLRSLLSSCASRGVQIRSMLWAGDPIPPPPTIVAILQSNVAVPWQLVKDYARTKTSRTVNDPAVQFINGLLASGNDAAAILDDRHLPMGSHHQKVVIVGAGGKLIAYVGGIEVNIDRVPPPVSSEPGSPLFDISVRLEDAGAWLVLNTFVRRWSAHPNNFGTPLRGDGLPVPSHAGPLVVQVTNTYGQGFPFATAVQTASTALANGIKSARQFFYMEDQYFVGSPKMKTAVNNALSSNPTLTGIIVIAAENSVSDLPDVAFRRRDFLGPLVSSFPDRLLVFERLGSGSTIGPTAYVHSKLLIVDDEAAFIGSVNSNRRSWFHDSEIDATIVDSTGPGGIAPGTRGWVRDFRCSLWAQHLNLSSALLGDFATCLTFWQAVISGQLVLINGNLVDISGTVSVRSYNATAVVQRYAIGGVPVASGLLDKAWDSLEDPT
jgi:phosphatidylserine/phosphatidylglycerophosphate/cardiolipin synthase-like enzyme